jgi:micrococcal nuclease
MHKTVLLIALALSASPATAAPFVLCDHGRPKAACVVDGDTFWLAGEKIRPVGFDAPEMGPPRCSGAGPLGRAARARMLVLMNSGPVALSRQGKDQFGRTLAIVAVGGREIGAVLEAEGLARPYSSSNAPWCE